MAETSDGRPARCRGRRSSADSLLEVRNVQVTFSSSRGLVHAVDGVDLDVRRGEVLALVGESGCGKTTLIRSILGLERMSAGTVVFDGSPVSQRAWSLRTLRRRVQMIFQDPSGALNPRHTIYEAVAEGIRIHKVRGRRADARGRRAGAGRPPPAGAVPAAVPARGVGRAASAGAHRRGDGARAAAAARRRTGRRRSTPRSAARSWR